jgi:hypothetical protein
MDAQEAIARQDAGRVYVRFSEQAGAISAQRALNNRTFSGNKVVIIIIIEHVYIYEILCAVYKPKSLK